MQDFLKFWGLRKPLFKEADLVHGIFIPRGFNRAQQRITLATENDNPFICITAPSGHGKTTLARWLTQRLPPLHYEALNLILMMPEDRSGWLLHRLAEFFNPAASSSDCLATVAKGLDELMEEKRRLLLVIDNAHHLMPGEAFNDIHSLLALQGSGTASVGIVLIGHDDLLKRIMSAGMLKNRLALKAKIEPLTAAETRDYLRTTLRQAGLAEDVMTESAMEAIARYSGGIYTVINALADNAFMEAFLSGEKTVDRNAVQAARDFMPQGEKTSLGKIPAPDVPLTEGTSPRLAPVPLPPKEDTKPRAVVPSEDTKPRRTVEEELRASHSDEEASIKLSSLFLKNKAK